MPTRQGLAQYSCRPIFPNRENIVFLSNQAVGTPQDQHWTTNLLVNVRFVMLEVDRSGCTVILARRVDRCWIAEAAMVFRICLRFDSVRHDRSHQELKHFIDTPPDERLRERRRLDQEE